MYTRLSCDLSLKNFLDFHRQLFVRILQTSFYRHGRAFLEGREILNTEIELFVR